MRTPYAVVVAVLVLAGCSGTSTTPGASAPSIAPLPSADAPAPSTQGAPAPSAPASSGDAVPPAAPGPTGAPTGAATPGGTPGCSPAFPANTRPDTGTASGGVLGLREVTSGPQPGYDRVVLTLSGSGVPGWRVEYVEQATSDGSGDPVDVAGTATLQVVATAVGVPDDTGVPFPSTRRLRPAGTTVVREVVLDGVFEGQATAFIGVTEQRPFRATRLAGPPRVVVDVRHC